MGVWREEEVVIAMVLGEGWVASRYLVVEKGRRRAEFGVIDRSWGTNPPWRAANPGIRKGFALISTMIVVVRSAPNEPWRRATTILSDDEAMMRRSKQGGPHRSGNPNHAPPVGRSHPLDLSEETRYT